MAPLYSLCSLSLLFSLLPLYPSSASLLPPAAPPLLPPTQGARHRTGLLAPILSNLGFQELAMAVPALYSPILSSWSGPVTLFAPSDDSIRSCAPFCSAPRLLREHIVPGLFSHLYLSKLAFGTKLETTSPGHCLTVTTTADVSGSNSSDSAKIFVDGVEITRPDLFNDGQIVIHGIQGIVDPLSPASCSQEPFPFFSPEIIETSGRSQGSAIMRLMLRDAILRLRDRGYSILALAMRVKYPELIGLRNMTVFALDDPSIFSGGHGYLTDVRFHVVPNRILMHSDLMKLPLGTVLPTLVHGQHLVVTQAGTGVGPLSTSVRINYVPITGSDVVYNARIVVHGIFLPFPHLYLADLASAAILGTAEDGILGAPSASSSGTCGAPTNGVSAADCPATPAAAPMISSVVDLDVDGI